jgi:hypothetical protein
MHKRDSNRRKKDDVFFLFYASAPFTVCRHCLRPSHMSLAPLTVQESLSRPERAIETHRCTPPKDRRRAVETAESFS